MSNLTISVSFDGKLGIRKGDGIKVFRGIVQSPISIRATSVENVTTGVKEKSSTDGVMMTQLPENLEPPLTGRVSGTIEFKDGATHFKILEGIASKRKDFTESAKREELISAGGMCRHCGYKLKPGGCDFDHKDNNPLNNNTENCQVLCKTCHGIKTESAKGLTKI